MVVMGAGLVPLHHRLEQIVLARLTRPRVLKHLSPIPIDAAENIAETEDAITKAIPSTEVEQDNSEQKKSASAADTTEAEEK